MNFTRQQQNAIDVRNSSVIVSAAAGSGKTAVLTERLAHIISDPLLNVRADRIIVVTFTNDAAAEMKKRLDRKIREMISEHPHDKYLLKQQALLQNARISTINSFCFELLRDNITEQGITSGFSVLDEADEKVIKSQAMEELFDWYSKNEYEKISVLYDRFCMKDHKPLVNLILSVDKFLSSVAISRDWLKKAVSEYKKEFCDSVYYNRFFENMLRKANIAIKLSEENISLIYKIFPDMNELKAKKSLCVAQSDLEKAEKFLEIVNKKSVPDDAEFTYISSLERLVTLYKDKDNYDEMLREVYKAKRDKLKNILKSSVTTFVSAESDFYETGYVTELLTEAVEKFRQIVWEKKCSKNSISFDDGERLALELLVDYDENGNIIQSEIARQTAEYYDIIMVDEYQDSNNKEDLIFKLLSRNYKLDSENNPMYGDNAFVVGDVKQSIYRFRLANPKNFISTMNNSTAYSADSSELNQYILLNRNFRSSPEVINFVNFVFSEIMTAECGDIDYNENEMLHFGAVHYSENDTADRTTHITFLNAENSENDSEEADDSNSDDDIIIESPEAEFTAEKIAKMLSDGAEVKEPDGTLRPCRPSDFTILIRKNRYIKLYVDALEKRGIPAKGSEEKGYLKSREIAVLIDILRIIANPLQDIPMASVMVSPMYTFGVEELAYIKSFDSKKSLYPLLIGIVSGEYPDFDVKLAERCDEFLKSIENFRLNSITMTIGELINSIYDTTDFISVMQLYSDGDKKRANLRLLIQYARNYEIFAASDGSGGLSGFLRHIDRILENDDYKQGNASSSTGDYIRVQTFHKSKGLEYPFVFMCELSSGFNKYSDNVICSDNSEIGFILYDKKLVRKYKTFQHTMLMEDNRQDSRSEEMRLLYVGLTRARQQIFINLNCNDSSVSRVKKLVEKYAVNNGSIREAVSEAGSFSDWLWICLMMHSEFPAIAQLIGIDAGFDYPVPDRKEKLFDYELVSGIEKMLSENNDEFIPAKADDNIVNNLRSIINSSYDRTLSETTAKLSVTQITKKINETEPFDFHLQRPEFLLSGSKLTGAERGTAIHTFFQYCDFEKASENAAAEIENLVNKGFLTKEQAKCVKPEKVRAFFSSELYRKIKSAVSYERERKFMIAASQLDFSSPVLEKLKNSDNMIKGIIDIMYEEPDGIVIVDYKSDRGLSEDKLAERYRNQLMLYKSAVELITEKKVKGLSLYSIELEKEIVIK